MERAVQRLPAADGVFPTLGRSDLAILGALALLALLVRLIPLLMGGGFDGVIYYDEGSYFASAVAMFHGRVPYRDFLVVQPPGILYLFAPFAMLANVLGDATAFLLTRGSFMLLGALNTVLVALVAGRLGRRSAVLAGGLYAVWATAAFVEHTAWLIAPQNTLLLLALLCLATPEANGAGVGPSTRRIAIAGGLLGLELAFQIWGVVPLAVVFGWLVLSTRRRPGGWVRPTLAYVIAAGVTAALAWLPFLIVAAPELIRYAVVDQLGRAARAGSIVERIRSIEGLSRGSVPRAIVVAGFLAVGATIAWAARSRPALRLWAVLLAVQLAVVFVVPPFRHYASWIAPAGALAIGGSADTIIGRLRGRGPWARAVSAAYALGLAILFAVSMLAPIGTPVDWQRLSATVADARCVTADWPVLLLQTDTLSRSLDNDCPLILDTFGTSIDADRGDRRPKRQRPEYQAAMAGYYGGGDAALFFNLPSDGLSEATQAGIHDRLPVTGEVGPILVLSKPSP